MKQRRKLNQNGLVEKFCHFRGLLPIIEALTEDGAEVRFVGGCVRNALLDLPIDDIDLATHLYPFQIIEYLEKADIKHIPTGLPHGTITAIHSGNSFEITTLRRDVSCDGRHADVVFTPYWSEDAMRRDFTMNAISCGIDDVLYDYTGGMEDLEDGIVRFVGSPIDRIKEDYLRILRFFRFHAHYGVGNPDPEAIKACFEEASGLRTLSGERIQQEMIKLLSAKDPTPTLMLLRDGSIEPFIGLPPLDPGSLTLILERERSPSPWLRLVWLLRNHQTSSEQILALRGRWKLSNYHTKYLKKLLDTHITHQNIDDITEEKKLIYELGNSLWKDLIILEWAEYTMKTGDDAYDRFQPLLAFGDTWEAPPFPVKGEDIMNMLHLDPGKEVGHLIKLGKDWWLSHACKPTKEEILDHIHSQI